MQEQIVRSYVRGRKQDSNVEEKKPSMVPAIAIGSSLTILLGVLFWQVTVPVAMVGVSAYGLKSILTQYKAAEDVVEPEAVEAPVERPKRHYQHRIVVNHYQTNKAVRV